MRLIVPQHAPLIIPRRRPGKHRRPFRSLPRYRAIATITYVASSAAGSSQAGSPETSRNCTLGAAVQRGDLILVFGFWDRGVAQTASVADNLSATNLYQGIEGGVNGTADETRMVNPNGVAVLAWGCLVKVAGTPTITITTSASVNELAIQAAAYRDVNQRVPIGFWRIKWQSAPGTGTDGAVTGPIVDGKFRTWIPPCDGCHLVVFGADTGALRASQFTAGTGFTLRFQQGSASALATAIEDTVQATAGPVSGSFTLANNDGTYTLVICLIPAGVWFQPRRFLTSFDSGVDRGSNLTGEEPPVVGGWLDATGFSTGLDWSDTRLLGGGQLVSHQVGGGFDDSIACLIRPWSLKQYARGIVKGVNTAADNCLSECELLAAWAMRPGWARGYEFGLNMDTTAPYMFINWWEGPVGIFGVIIQGAPSQTPADGMTMELTYDGETGDLKAYLNGVLEMSGNDKRWGFGAPGWGFFHDDAVCPGAGNPSRWGFIEYEARDLDYPRGQRPPAGQHRT